ncbi:MAG: hypothetical protein ABIN58_00360 [candidate division WOR-3 bacterium]
MKCHSCMQELAQGARYCPSCGQAISLSLDKGGNAEIEQASGLSVAESAQTGITVDKLHQEEAIAGTNARPREWNPKKEKVKGWASKELNHYEVLELDEEATDAEVAERIVALEARLEQWARILEADLQELGKEGQKRLYEMKEAMRDRARYNAEVKQDKHRRTVEEARKTAWEYARDGILQWYEWMSLRGIAQEKGLSEKELDEILQELEDHGVLTGITVAGRKVRTLEELRDVCGARGDDLVEAIWQEEMDRWLEHAINRKDLAIEVKAVKEQYRENKRLGTHIFLWTLGEKRLVLKGPGGEQAVANLKQWVEGAYDRGLVEASVEALEDGRLEQWLRKALGREDLAGIAAREREKGRRGLWRLIWQTGERVSSLEAAYKTTSQLVQDEPDFWEAQYQHAVHCRMTGRLKEMQQHLKTAIRGDWTNSSRALVDSEFEEVREQVNALLEQMRTEDFQARLEMWRRGCVEPAAEREVLTIEDRGRLLDEAERRGIDRITAERVLNQALPRLEIQPPTLDFGVLKRGARANQEIRIGNVAGGQLRGTVKPGVSWITVAPEKLDPTKREQIVEVHIDTSGLKVGSPIFGSLVVETSGGVEPVPVSVAVKRSTSAQAVAASFLALLLVTAFAIFFSSGSSDPGPLPNSPPAIRNLSAQPDVVERGQDVRITVEAEDPEGDPLNFECNPSGGVIVGNGPMFTLKTSDIDTGSDPRIKVTARVSDGHEWSPPTDIWIKVNPTTPPPTDQSDNPHPNTDIRPPPPPPAPTVQLTASSTSVRAGDSVSLNASASGESLKDDWWKSAGELEGDGLSRRLKTSLADVGQIKVSVTVRDRYGRTASDEVTIAVERPPNRPPQIEDFSAIPSEVLLGKSVTLTVRASDPDSDNLEYNWVWSDGSLRVQDDRRSAILSTSNIPISGQAIRVTVTVTVKDGRGGTDSRSFVVTVRKPEIPPGEVTLKHQAYMDKEYLVIRLTNSSATAGRGIVSIQVEARFQNGRWEVTEARGSLPGVPCMLTDYSPENVRDKTPSISEPLSPTNKWASITFRIRPEDAQRPVRITIKWRTLQ